MSKAGKKSAKDKQKSTNQDNETLNILVDFSFPTCWGTTKVGSFCNFLKDEDSFFKCHGEIFNNLVPELSCSNFANLYTKIKHCHLIREEDKIKCVKDIFANIYSEKLHISKKAAIDYYNQNFNESPIYQVGNKGSLRIVGVREGNHHFKLLFIDYLHLIYPDQKYNDSDTSNYTFSVHERGSKND